MIKENMIQLSSSSSLISVNILTIFVVKTNTIKRICLHFTMPRLFSFVRFVQQLFESSLCNAICSLDFMRFL